MNAAETKISKALDHAVDLKKAGSSPNDAVIGGAKLAGLNPDMTDRLVEAFNIALTNSTIKKMGDKTASFPIADKSEVMRGVFSDLESSSGERKEASISEEPFFSVERSNPGLGWAGIGSLRKEAQLEAPLIAKSYAACDAAKAELSKLAVDVLAAETEVTDSFFGLCGKLTQSDGSHKFAALEEQVLCERGPSFAPVLDNIYKAAGLDRFKVARFTGTTVRGSYFPPNEIHQAFEHNLAAISKLAEVEDRHQKASIETEKSVRETEDLVGQLNEPFKLKKRASPAADLLDAGFDFAKHADDRGDNGDKGDKPSPGAGDMISSFSKAVPSPFDKSHGLIPSVQAGASKAVGDEYQRGFLESQKRFYQGPKDESAMEMDNLKRHRILAELVSNDEIISKIPHHKIEQSYGSLLNLAPELTLDPSIVAGWLRNAHSSQALDPFSAGQLVKVHQDLVKTKAIEGGQIKPS
jgi:hypothetical protein